MSYPLNEFSANAVAAAVKTALHNPLGIPVSPIVELTTKARNSLKPDNIPAELRDRPQWVVWRYETADKKDGKAKKIPVDARTGRNAKTNDKTTWNSFQTAVEAFSGNTRYAGIGFCLDASDGLVGGDIDDYGNDPLPTTIETLSHFAGTYAEVSPSGGRRFFCYGKPRGKAGTKVGMFELYRHPSNRYLTLTGNVCAGHPQAITEQQAALEWLETTHMGLSPVTPTLSVDEIAELLGVGGGDCLTTTCPQCGAAAEYPDCANCGHDFTQSAARPTANPTDRTDTERGAAAPQAPIPSVSVGLHFDAAYRLEKALRNPLIAGLYSGNLCGHPSRSEAELALVLRLLTFADGDTGTVSAWLDGSGCTKWIQEDRTTYRQATLDKALSRWDGACFEDHRKPGQAGHSDRTQAGHEPPDTGHPEMSGSEPPVKKPLFVDAADLLATLQPPRWLVKKWIAADSLTTLFGAPGSGKSFVAIDVACCVAAGQSWNEHRTATGQVLYIAGEGHVGFARRLTAWQAVHGAIPANRLFVSVRTITLDAGGAQAVLDAIGELSEVPLLIVVDTLATTIAGNENDAADMALFIRCLKTFQASTQAAVVVVHHTGHGDKTRARGHSSLHGAIDTELKVELADGGRTLACTKQKDAEPPATVGFTLTTAVLGEDEDGDPITSCTVSYGQPESATSKQRTPPAAQRIALKALETALVNHGETHHGDLCVHLDEWRQAAYAAGIADTAEAKQKAFSRTRTTLVSNGDVVCTDDFYRFAETGRQAAANILFAQKKEQQQQS